MASHRHAHQLNYFQQPPVRGQLEPITADGYTRTGWRWLQCTDTPNELRVLLPPRTALVYAQLLRVETAELAKDERASWERIMQIRHLKDRMLRKCQRLARGSVPHDRNTPYPTFLTIHAPPDFRLKEMERWFRDQGPDVANLTSAETHTRPYCCEKCGPPTHTVPPASAPAATTSRRREPSTTAVPSRTSESKRTAAQSSRHAIPASSSQRKRSKSKAQPVPVPTRSRQTERRASSSHRSPLTSPPKPTPQRARSRSVSPYHGLRTESPRPSGVMSPDPIPIPYRPSRDNMHSRLAPPTPPPLTESPEPMDHERISPEFPEPQVFPEPQAEPPKPSSPGSTLVDFPQEQVPFPTSAPLETIHENEWVEEPESSTRPRLPRRRSSLKKSGSRLSLISQKSVTWAMDRNWEDQISKYTKAVDEADVLAHELEDARQVYHDHISEMRRLCRHIISASEKVRLESENLHHQEEIMHKQEDKLMECCGRLERMELQYREQVLTILDETKRVVQLCDKKRED